MAGIALAVAGVSAAAGLAGAAMSASAAKKASKTQAAAAQQQSDAQREMFEKQVELQEPFRQGGLAAQNRLLLLLGLPGGEAGPESAAYGRYGRTFAMSDFQADPGYAFRMSEGMKALENSAAARGGLLSGTTLKGIQRFGQDLASQEYTNAFNRYYTERQAQLNPLQAFLGQGQSATNQMGQAAQNFGQGMAQAYGNMGQARASGYVGQANAINQGISGINQGIGQYMNYSMFNRMFPQQNVNNFAPTGAPYAYGTAGYMGEGPFIT